METYEKGFLVAAAVVLVVFLAALAYSTLGLGVVLPTESGRVYCRSNQKLLKVLRQTPPFNAPGLKQIAPGRYEAVVIGRTWAFTPDEIDVPVGAEVTFRATSADVVHGFFIPNTRVNMMLIPGEISVATYKFTRPGEYLILCHEYCGMLHHTMSGKVVVK
ncbi:MAG: cytochrome c oxidase subunit II [Candidatus Binataceae bacterium]